MAENLTLLIIELIIGIVASTIALCVLVKHYVEKKSKINLWFIVFFCVIIFTYAMTIILYNSVGWVDLETAGLESTRYWIFWINHSILLIYSLISFYIKDWLKWGWILVGMYIGMGLILLFIIDQPFRFTGIFQLGIIIPGIYVFFKVFAVKRDGRSLGLACGMLFFSLGGMFKAMLGGYMWAEILGFIFKTVGPIIFALATLGVLEKSFPPKTDKTNIE